MLIAQTRKGRSLHVVDQDRDRPGGTNHFQQKFYSDAGWLYYAVCGEMVGEPLPGRTEPTCKDCLAKLKKSSRRDRVRVGANFNAATNESEVTRIDFDVEDGRQLSVVVEYLGSRKCIVVDLVEIDLSGGRELYHLGRLARFEDVP